jgi:hypothetical protein
LWIRAMVDHGGPFAGSYGFPVFRGLLAGM